MSDPTIRETIPVPPPERRRPGRPRKPRENTATAVREYVSAGGLSPSLAALYRALPIRIDDIEREIGADTYAKMLQDPQIASDVGILKQAVITQEVQVQPAVGEEDPDYKTAVEYAEFCSRCLQRLSDFRAVTLFQMLDAVPFGHKLAEVTYEVATNGQDAGKIVPRGIKVKPRESYAFVVDAYMNTLGILASVPGTYSWGMAGITGVSAEELADLPNLLPRGKFCVLTLLGRDHDPRGVSWLRSAYHAWWLKTQLWPEYYKYLIQFASPSIIGIAAEDAHPTPEVDADGFPIEDDSGLPVIGDPLNNLLKAILTFRNSTAMAVPHGTEVRTLFAYTNGDAFRLAIDLLNHEMNQGILYQSLATMEAQFGSRAASQTHQDILGLPIQYVRTVVEEMIDRDLFDMWVRLNFGDDAARLAPKSNIGDTEEQDFANKASSVAALFKADYFDASQLREMDQLLGVPVRTAEEADARGETRRLAAELLAHPPEPGGAGETGGGGGSAREANGLRGQEDDGEGGDG